MNFSHPHDVHLWKVKLPDFVDAITQYAYVLDAEERARAARFHFDIHRQRYQIAHIALRFILSAYSGKKPEALQFYVGEKKKPYLQDDSELQFNLSHSEEMALIGVRQQYEIGVDVEQRKTSIDISIAERVFNATEVDALSRSTDKTQAFYALWAGKEALIKTVGGSIFQATVLSDIDFTKPEQIIQLTHHATVHPLQLSLLTEGDYQLAVSTFLPVNQFIITNVASLSG